MKEKETTKEIQLEETRHQQELAEADEIIQLTGPDGRVIYELPLIGKRDVPLRKKREKRIK